MDMFLQMLISGLTVGATYALIGLGFSMIYNTSGVTNFAQGDFVMIGGMAAVSLHLQAHFPLSLAVVASMGITVLVGILVEKLAIQPVRQSKISTLIILTIAVSIILRGIVQVTLGKDYRRLDSFFGERTIALGSTRIDAQVLWVVGSLVIVMVLLAWFFNRTRVGKAMLATSQNRMAAELMGINVKSILMISFALSALFGAVGGVVTAPITTTRYDVGMMLGLKGYCAAVFGGLGTATGALAGGLILGLAESLAAGYISFKYKDAVAFVIILAVLFFFPSGMFGRREGKRV